MSTPDLKTRVEAIRARHAAATRGPWKWFGYLGARNVSLEAPGMNTVMDFIRWGMNGAQPRFNTKGLLDPLSDLVVPDSAEGRGRITDVNHPDARFMANAWQDVADLLARVAELERAVDTAGHMLGSGAHVAAEQVLANALRGAPHVPAGERTEWSIDPRLAGKSVAP